jgi:hypothetical protein
MLDMLSDTPEHGSISDLDGAVRNGVRRISKRLVAITSDPSADRGEQPRLPGRTSVAAEHRGTRAV